MAVIEDLGLAVTIQVNGAPLDEYVDPTPCEDTPVDENAPPVCSNYVEVKDGAEYAIHLKALKKNQWISRSAPKDHILSMKVYMDGKLQMSTKSLFRENKDRFGGVCMDGVAEYRDSHRRNIRKFKFHTLNIGEKLSLCKAFHNLVISICYMVPNTCLDS